MGILRDEPGDRVPVESAMFHNGADNTTSLTWANALASVTDMVLIDDETLSELDYDRYYIRLIGTLHNDTAGATTRHRLIDSAVVSDHTQTEISMSGTSYPTRSSPWVEYLPSSTPTRIGTEYQVSSGTGTVYTTKVVIAGER